MEKGLEENQKDLRDVEATKIAHVHPSKKWCLQMPSKNFSLFTDVKLHLELAMAIHEMVDMGDDSSGSIEEEDVNENQNNEHHSDIYNDVNCLTILNWRKMLNECMSQELIRVKKRILNYY